MIYKKSSVSNNPEPRNDKKKKGRPYVQSFLTKESYKHSYMRYPKLGRNVSDRSSYCRRDVLSLCRPTNF